MLPPAQIHQPWKLSKEVFFSAMRHVVPPPAQRSSHGESLDRPVLWVGVSLRVAVLPSPALAGGFLARPCWVNSSCQRASVSIPIVGPACLVSVDSKAPNDRLRGPYRH